MLSKMQTRRNFLGLLGGAAAVAAPAVVQAEPRSKGTLPSRSTKPLRSQPGSLTIRPGVEFASNSYVHAPLAPNAPIDPNSAVWVAELTRQCNVHAGGIFALVASGSPLYIVGPDQPTVRVVSASTTPGDEYLRDAYQARILAVPMPDPDHFLVEAGTDHTVCIYQPSTKTCWEMWGTEKTGRKTTDSLGRSVDEWSSWWGGRMDRIDLNPGAWTREADPNWNPDGFNYGARASGLPLMAGMMTVDELMVQKVIKHPIHLCVVEALAHQWSSPAQRTDGGSIGPQYFPEGTIFRFTPDVDLTAWVGHTWYPILVAIRDYGMVVCDRGGTLILYAENASTPVYGGVDPYASVPPGEFFIRWEWLPVNKLRVLQTTMRP
jgi:hypothetical protein